MPDFVCPDCGHILSSKQALDRHSKTNCKEKQFQCTECKIKFKTKKTLTKHKRSDCKGAQKSITDRDEQIESLQTAMAAASGLKSACEEKATAQTNIQNNLSNCHIGDVNNIQININVLPLGSENIEHLKNIAIEDLREKIGLKPDASTMVEFFRMIRLDTEHPENHNLLLTSKDSDRIHYFHNDEWREGCYQETLRNALIDDKQRLRELIGFKNRDETFYWGYLERHVGQKINEKDHIALKPIYDGIRDPLLESSLKLAAKHDPQAIKLNNEVDEQHASIKTADVLAIEQEKTRQKNEDRRRTELELEILKLKLAANIPIT